MNYWDNLVSERLQWCSPCGSEPEPEPYTGYGVLYNWWGANKNGGTGVGSIAPSGWHLPTNIQMVALRSYLDPVNLNANTNIAGGMMKEIGTTYWASPNTGASNSSGFDGKGSGHRSNNFSSLTYDLGIWNTYNFLGSGGIGVLYYNKENFLSSNFMSANKWAGYSIRLMKDDATDPGSLTDIDGNIYPTVKIGTQVLMASNLKVTHYNDGIDIPIGGADPTFYTDAEWMALTTEAMCWYNNTPS